MMCGRGRERSGSGPAAVSVVWGVVVAMGRGEGPCLLSGAAGLLRLDLLAPGGSLHLGLLDLRLLALVPGLVVRVAQADDAGVHVRVVAPAQLGALAVEHDLVLTGL